MDYLNNEQESNKILENIVDISMLSIMFVICSIPVFTMGAAFTALSECVMKKIETKDKKVHKEFLNSMKKHFKNSTGAWLIYLLLFVLFGFVVYQTTKGSGIINETVSNVLFPVSAALMCLIFMECMYLFPVQAKFSNKIGIQMKSALIMSIKNILNTVLLAFILAVVVGLLYFETLVAGIIMAIFGIGAVAYIYNRLMLVCFKPYLEPLFADMDSAKESEKVYENKSEKDAVDTLDVEDANAISENINENHDNATEMSDTGNTSFGIEDKTEEVDKINIEKSKAGKDIESDSVKKDENENNKKGIELEPAEIAKTKKKKNIEIIDTEKDKDIVATDTKETLNPADKKKSITLTDAAEDERERIENEKRAVEIENARVAKEADEQAKETARILASKVKTEETYDTAGENVYRRVKTEDGGKQSSRTSGKKKKQRRL